MAASHDSLDADLDHGREAARQQDIPARGSWDITVRVAKDLGRDNASLISSGLATYALLAVFPALTAATSLYGLIGSPDRLVSQLQGFAHTMPPGVWALFASQLHALGAGQHGPLCATAGVSLLVALWSATAGMWSLLSATKIAYGEREKRSLPVQLALSLLFTLCAALAFIVILTLAVVVPLVLAVIVWAPGCTSRQPSCAGCCCGASPCSRWH